MNRRDMLITLAEAIRDVPEEYLPKFLGMGRAIDARIAAETLHKFAQRCDENLKRRPLTKRECLYVLLNFVRDNFNRNALLPMDQNDHDDIKEALEVLGQHAAYCDNMLRKG